MAAKNPKKGAVVQKTDPLISFTMSVEMEKKVDPRIKDFEWNLNTACNFEKATGHSINELKLDSNIDFKALVWAGLVTKYKDLTEDDVGRMIDFVNYPPTLFIIRAKMRGEKNWEPRPTG